VWQLLLTRAVGRKGYKALAGNPFYAALGRGLTFTWFAFTLFWFWGNWQQIDGVFNALDLAHWCSVWLTMWLSATIVLAAWEWLRAALGSIHTVGGSLLTSRYLRVVFTTALGLACILIVGLLNQPAPGIVYKAF
jgi:hypothetical protein